LDVAGGRLAGGRLTLSPTRTTAAVDREPAGSPPTSAAEETLETTTVRLEKDPGICRAPRYVAEALLRAEGLTDIRHVERASHWRQNVET